MQPIINLDDPVGKTVGKRKPPVDALGYALTLQATLNQLAPAWRRPGKWRGVFRFHSHEEADEWMMARHLRKNPN